VAYQIGDVQVRNAGTIGGSIAHADPAADWPAALLAADATIEIRGSRGTRYIAAADFFTGIYSTDLGSDEIITEIRVPSLHDKKSHYEKFAQPASRFALVGCAVCASITTGRFTGVRVAFTGVSDTPYCDQSAQSALEGKSVSGQTITDAVASLDTSVFIMSDLYASEKYRRHLAGVMLSRALKAIC
jgi:carbon-monoxide dehydrogenase medium subunit